MKPGLGNFLKECESLLKPLFGDDAEREARVLVSSILNVTPTALYLENFAESISNENKKKIMRACQRRSEGEPLQYLTGKAFFYREKFEVGPGVLIPRHDTELLVDDLLYRIKDEAGEELNLLEFCTGSGAISLSLLNNLKKQKKKVFITATDISEDALAYAKKNAESYKLEDKVLFIKHDLLSGDFSALQKHGKGKNFDMIYANPPYIASSVINTLHSQVKSHEPLLALDGGADGLDFYPALSEAGRMLLKAGGFLALEIGYDQADTVMKILKNSKAYKQIEVHKDLGGNPRMVSAVRGK